VGFGVWG